jgi:oxygen-independent coproporphyrinogen-3 oxidase
MSDLIEAARTAGFESIGITLMFGRPRQTLRSFAATVERVVALRPDRTAFYSCDRPSPGITTPDPLRGSGLRSRGSNLKLLALAAEQLMASGYVYIGMGQFALPDDSLSAAQREGRLN